jgi:hypothetical protein
MQNIPDSILRRLSSISSSKEEINKGAAGQAAVECGGREDDLQEVTQEENNLV